jgi:hypothetical protein
MGPKSEVETTMPGLKEPKRATQLADAVNPAKQSAKSKDLRGLNYDEGRAALSPEANEEKDSFLTDLFARIDANGDKGVSRKEVIAHLKRVGVGGGFMGLVHKKTADSFLEHLDKDKDKKVTWAEFQAVAQQVMPAALFDEKGNVKPELVDKVYKDLNTKADKGISRKEFEKGADAQLPKDMSFRGTVIEVAAKLGLDALDVDKDGFVSKLELQRAARSVAALKDKDKGRS